MMSAKFSDFPLPFYHCAIHRNLFFSIICFWATPPLRTSYKFSPQRHMAPKSHKYRIVGRSLGRCDVHLSAAAPPAPARAQWCSALRSVPICPTDGRTDADADGGRDAANSIMSARSAVVAPLLAHSLHMRFWVGGRNTTSKDTKE